MPILKKRALEEPPTRRRVVRAYKPLPPLTAKGCRMADIPRPEDQLFLMRAAACLFRGGGASEEARAWKEHFESDDRVKVKGACAGRSNLAAYRRLAALVS